jgi:hypothetical protein
MSTLRVKGWMNFCLEQTVTTTTPVRAPEALSGSVQRPALARLTRGNVGASPPPQNDTPKTGLRG